MDLPLRLIVNPTSGGGQARRALPKVVAELHRAKKDFSTVFTKSIAHADELSRQAVDEGFLVVAIGGDGFVGAICGAVAGHKPKEGLVGIVPAGRGNDFARFIGVRSIKAATNALINGQTVSIDLGKVNGKFFTTTASVGMDSDVIELGERVRIVKGKFVYAYSALRALAQWKDVGFTLKLAHHDGRASEERLRGYNVVVANSGYYGGGMRIAPNASVTDGQFDVISIGEMPKLKILTRMPKLFSGAHLSLTEVRSWQAVSVEVNSERSLAVYADGEKAGFTPALIETVPKALQILVPRSSPIVLS